MPIKIQRSHAATLWLSSLLLACGSLLFVGYWLFSQDIERTLISREWTQNTVLILPTQIRSAETDDSEGNPRLIEKINVSSTTKFLQDGVFVKNLNVQAYRVNPQGGVEAMPNIEFSIDGVWELVDNYLLTKNTNIHNLPTARGMELSAEEVDNLRQRLIILEQETKRVDKLAKDKLLLTGLNQDSQLLYAE